PCPCDARRRGVREFRRALARWSLVAAAASLVSRFGPFFGAGGASGFLAGRLVRGTPVGITRLFLPWVPAGGRFLALWAALYASMRTSTFMQTYWGEFFPHPPVGTAIREAVGLGRLVWVFLLLGSPSEPMLPAKTLTVLLLLWIGG